MLHRRDGRGVEGAMGLLRRRSWGEGRAAAQSGQRWGQAAGAGPAAGQSHKSHKDAVGDDGDVCALCCTKSNPEKMSMYGKC